jgi:hypothetical protein
MISSIANHPIHRTDQILFTFTTMSIITKTIVLMAALCIAGPGLAGSSLSLSGTYTHRTDETSLELIGDAVCFHPSTASAKLLPRPPSDKRSAWFCLTNGKRAKALLAIPVKGDKAGCGSTGTATITVTNYVTYLGEGDGFDTALLQSVASRSGTKVLACE